MLIAKWLIRFFGSGCVRVQGPITIPGEAGLTNEPEPDVAITVADASEYHDHHPAPEELLLIVEAADSSLPLDLSTKALLYARAGVRDYWVVDVQGRRIHIHREPTDSGYNDVHVFAEEEAVSLLLRPDAASPVEKLLPSVKLPDAV